MASIPFDGIGTFLVFLVGLPALVIQSMSPEARRVVLRRWKLLVLETSLPLIAAVLVLAVALAVRPFWQENDTLWIIVLTALVMIAVVSAVYMLNRYGRQEAVIADLKKQAARRLDREGRLVEQSLQLLVELGEQSTPGEDKQLVLEALYDLTDRVCRHPRYRGDALEDLVRRLVDILASNSQPGSAKNFHTAAEILQVIVITADTLTDLSSADLIFTIRALGSLSRAALTHTGLTVEAENTVMNCIQSLRLAASSYPGATTEASEALFQIGAMALERQEPLIATAALDRLITLVQVNRPAAGELVADTLGLLGHFASGGETLSEYVAEKLAEIEEYLELPRLEALKAARQHCAQTNQFQTADHLLRIIRKLEPPVLLPATPPADWSVRPA